MENNGRARDFRHVNYGLTELGRNLLATPISIVARCEVALSSCTYIYRVLQISSFLITLVSACFRNFLLSTGVLCLLFFFVLFPFPFTYENDEIDRCKSEITFLYSFHVFGYNRKVVLI